MLFQIVTISYSLTHKKYYVYSALVTKTQLSTWGEGYVPFQIDEFDAQF